MMKSLILGMISLVSLGALGSTPEGYRIEGKCADPNAKGRVTIIAYNDNSVLDTIAKGMIQNGKVVLTGSVPKQKVAYLLINDRLKDYIPMILENKNYELALDGDVVLALTGSEEQDILSKYIGTCVEQNKLMQEFRERPMDDRRNDSIKKLYRERDAKISIKMKEEQFKLLEQYPECYATPLFFNMGLRDKGLEELTHIYGKLTGRGKDNSYAKKILQRIERLKALEKGALAPNFTMPTPDGQSLSLYDVPAKVKIIDFWASWCYPCRKENPFMVKLYEKYHDKGLEIIGVSLDDNRKRWTDAIAKDGLPWLHVSELKKWKCEAVTLYDVKAVPHTVIINEKNEVIARNVRGAELEKLIEKLLGAQ